MADAGTLAWKFGLVHPPVCEQYGQPVYERGLLTGDVQGQEQE
ncbi:hypothetical protein [Paenibacillus sp. GCM10012303]